MESLLIYFHEPAKNIDKTIIKLNIPLSLLSNFDWNKSVWLSLNASNNYIGDDRSHISTLWNIERCHIQ